MYSTAPNHSVSRQCRPWQTVWMCRLIWAFAVRICPKGTFTHFARSLIIVDFVTIYNGSIQELILSMLHKKFSRKHFEIFFLYFSEKIRFDILCKLSPMETICIKCRILFSQKNKKKFHPFVVCWLCPWCAKFFSVVFPSHFNFDLPCWPMYL